MRIKLKVILIFLIAHALSFGQITITGNVVSEEVSMGIPGVFIMEVGT